MGVLTVRWGTQLEAKWATGSTWLEYQISEKSWYLISGIKINVTLEQSRRLFNELELPSTILSTRYSTRLQSTKANTRESPRENWLKWLWLNVMKGSPSGNLKYSQSTERLRKINYNKREIRNYLQNYITNTLFRKSIYWFTINDFFQNFHAWSCLVRTATVYIARIPSHVARIPSRCHNCSRRLSPDFLLIKWKNHNLHFKIS